MALGDVTIYADAAFGYPGDISFDVGAGAAASINAGEPVAKALGNGSGEVVSALTTSNPIVGTVYMAGISATTSTDTTSATGSVSVTKATDGVTYLCAPKTASTWNVQTKYNALVGARVNFDLTNGVYTINATDASTNGLIVEPLDITKFPNKVRFTIRQGALYTA